MIDVEEWTSDKNRTEKHFFIQGGNIGYQHNTYLFGYNPDIIPRNVADKILQDIQNYLRSVKKNVDNSVVK